MVTKLFVFASPLKDKKREKCNREGKLDLRTSKSRRFGVTKGLRASLRHF